MASANALIEGMYVRDLLQQTEALQRTLQEAIPDGVAQLAAWVASAQPPLILLTGMGSSFHALHPMAVGLATHGVAAIMVETSELLYYREKLLTPNTLLVAVSQSGRSAEVVRLMKLNQGKARMIAVTNDAASPLALGADHTVQIRAGEEATVSCKTYLCTLLALDRITKVLCGLPEDPAELNAITVDVDGYLRQWRSHVDHATECLRGVSSLMLVGRGASLATAGTGGLIIKEAARFPAEGMSAAAFRHGPLEMVSSRLLLLVMQGDEQARTLNERLAREVQGLGGRVGVIGTDSPEALFRIAPTYSDGLRAILEMLPVQMFSLALAARDGHEAGAFSRARKITDIE